MVERDFSRLYFQFPAVGAVDSLYRIGPVPLQHPAPVLPVGEDGGGEGGGGGGGHAAPASELPRSPLRHLSQSGQAVRLAM